MVTGAKSALKCTPARGIFPLKGSTRGRVPLGKECTMYKHTTMATGRASLCALGEYLRRHCFFAPLRESVQIRQKTVRYRPIDRLVDGLSGVLCGGKGMAQSDVADKTDSDVLRAFERIKWGE